MDYSIIYILIAVVFTIGILTLKSFLTKKNIIKNEDLLFTAKILNLTVALIDELDLPKEKLIKDIGKIVYDALAFTSARYSTKDEVIVNAVEYAYDLCLKFDIELTDSRRDIIRELVVFAINNETIQYIV